MNQIKSFYLLVFIGCLSLSCEKESTSPQSAFTVSGYVYYMNKPVENVTVSIDQKYNWTINTNSTGFFRISGVSSGDHEVKMKKTLL